LTIIFLLSYSRFIQEEIMINYFGRGGHDEERMDQDRFIAVSDSDGLQLCHRDQREKIR